MYKLILFSKKIFGFFRTYFLGRAFGRWSSGYIGDGFKTNGIQQIFCENNVYINENLWVSFNEKDAKLIIGAGVYIGRFCTMSISSKVKIEKKALISDRVFFGDCRHIFDNTNVPIVDQGLESLGEINIGSGCWIGIGVVILPGVSVGKNAVIGANSVVTKNIPDYAVAAGVPAVVKKILKVCDG
jgi:acetyltransferase-like isoleucine patch superfamily enzyme